MQVSKKPIQPEAEPLNRLQWLVPVVLLLAWAILAGAIRFGVTRLREEIRSQITHHDGEMLYAVVKMEQNRAAAAGEMAWRLQDPAGQFALALELSQLKEGVLAAQLFDTQGKLITAVPALAREVNLTRAELAQLAQFQPVSHYHPQARLDEFFIVGLPESNTTQARIPLHRVQIPLHAPGQTNLLGAAQLILDGGHIAQAFSRLDQSLWREAIAAFAISGTMLGIALGWGFHRLQRINRRLRQQTTELRRANQELCLAAKTSALGAVTAHLMHGLASPLSGLQNYVAARAQDDAESMDALRQAQRLQALVGDTVRLLSEENGDLHYELPLAELADLLTARFQPIAQAAGVRLECCLQTDAWLLNRDANLLGLILENLLRNAIEATPAGRTVRMVISPAAADVICQVEDQGPGLPPTVRENLFCPCRSSKAGGHGIGLAISKQLARHLSADLQLARCSETGSTFTLKLPSLLFHSPAQGSAFSTV